MGTKQGTTMKYDTELLDWLETNSGGYALVSDDNGHWACTNAGTQNVCTGKKASDVMATFYIEKKEWKKSIREAIKSVME